MHMSLDKKAKNCFMCWKTFEQFKKKAFTVWIVARRKESHKWQLHRSILEIAIRLKYVKPPTAAKQISIGEKHKR